MPSVSRSQRQTMDNSLRSPMPCATVPPASAHHKAEGTRYPSVSFILTEMTTACTLRWASGDEIEHRQGHPGGPETGLARTIDGGDGEDSERGLYAAYEYY